MITRPLLNFPVCRPGNISNILKLQHRGIDVCLLAYIYLYSVNLHFSNYFPAVYMDGNQMLYSWYFTHAYNLSSHKFLFHNRFFNRLFPPLFVCYKQSTCVTRWYRFNCSRGKLGDSSSCFTPMEGENIELESLESLLLIPVHS